MTTDVNVLDHGYVRLIESWGSDERVVETARMSTQGAFVSWEPYPGHPRGDQGLLDYLWRNRHSSPFEFAGLTVEVQAPLFIFRQWHRHRTQSYNEASARYCPLPEIDYLPTVERLMRDADKSNRQAGRAKGAKTLTREFAGAWLDLLEEQYRLSQGIYRSGLENGIPKELARLALTAGRYSKMRASANLLNWLRFERLRLDSHAQPEIQEYAHAVGAMLSERFPRTWALFEEGRGL